MNFGDLPRGSRRIVASVSTLVLLVFGVFVAPQPAQADPHGVFFTVVGQQQLFFNVLASLNQADYVETPQLRDALLARRQEAGFGPEQNLAANATDTELANLLVRPVTLEGNDVWTTYLLHQLALETYRSNSSDEIFRIFCERGLGKIGCSDSVEAQRQPEAFRTTSDSRTKEIALGVLQSLDPDSEYVRKQRELNAHPKNPNTVTYIPRPLPIVTAREQANESPGKGLFVNSILNMAATGVGTIDSATLNSINVDLNQDTGEIDVNLKGSDPTVTGLLGVTLGLASYPAQASDAVRAAVSSMKEYQNLRSPRGDVLARAEVVKEEDKQGRNISSEVRFKEPALYVEEAVAGIYDLGAQKSATQYFTPVEGPYQDGGGRDLLERAGGANQGTGTQQGAGTLRSSAPAASVAGVQTSGAQTGEVAGILDTISGIYDGVYQYYDTGVDRGQVNEPIQRFTHGEANALDLERGNERFEEENCGFCLNFSGVLDWFLEIARQLLCFLFGICF